MKIKQCEGCKYYKDIDFGNKHLLGSSWSGYCTYYPKTTRKQLRCVRRLKQQLKSQAEEIVKKINSEIYTRMVVERKETKYTDINLILDTILKEYQK